MAAIAQVTRLGRELGLEHSPWAMVKLFQTYSVSAGMYGCQLWGSRYVHMRRMFDADVSKRHLRYLKLQLGVPFNVPSWTTLWETNCRPYHYYWVRAVCRFQDRILNSNSPLLVDVAKACSTCCRGVAYLLVCRGRARVGVDRGCCR